MTKEDLTLDKMNGSKTRNFIEERVFGKIDFNLKLEKNLPVLQELRLNLELCITDTLFLYEGFEPMGKLVSDYITALNLKSRMHLPFYGLQLGCKDRYIRQLSYDLVMKGLQRSAELNFRKAIMHISFPPHIPSSGKEKWLHSFCLNLEKLLNYCQGKGITLLLENTYEHDTYVFEKIFEHFPTSSLEMCLDIGHIYCYSSISLRDWWDCLNGKITVVHLSDNDGSEDSHLALGEGKIDFEELFTLSITQDTTYTLETEVSCFKRSIQYLKETPLTKGID